ncbi:hypothetical protein C8259_16440 [Nocardia nova]|uniref:Uncharacterized protein n=1 Tax=Nocardia nova TaxID=37330 RepID=A0A2T2Z407_9NOCA|nr:hypothetical protein C8259_16440 [Nocardia nova]
MCDASATPGKACIADSITRDQLSRSAWSGPCIGLEHPDTEAAAISMMIADNTERAVLTHLYNRTPDPKLRIAPAPGPNDTRPPAVSSRTLGSGPMNSF